MGPVPISSSGRGRFSKWETMLIQRDDLRCAEKQRPWVRGPGRESIATKADRGNRAGRDGSCCQGMQYSCSAYLPLKKFRLCMGRNESSQRGVLDILVKGTPIPLRKAQPQDQPKQAQRVKPEVGQKRPLQNLEPAFIPNVGHLVPVESAAEGLVRSGPALELTHTSPWPRSEQVPDRTPFREALLSRCVLVGGEEIARGNDAVEHAKAATGLRQAFLDARGGGTASRRAKSGVVGDRLACCKRPKSRPWPNRSSTRVGFVSQLCMGYTQMRRLFLRGEVSPPGVAWGEKLRILPWRRDLPGDTRGRISSRDEQDAAVFETAGACAKSGTQSLTGTRLPPFHGWGCWSHATEAALPRLTRPISRS